MKLTLLFLTAAFVQVNAAGYSQTLTISVKDAPLAKVFSEIEKQTTYNFIYADKLLIDTKPVTLQVIDEKIETVLALCFKDQPLTYNISDSYIIIKPKNQLLQVRESLIDTIDVRGRIVNEKNEPIPGASVLVKGTKMGTYTDADGNFELNRIAENATLLISAVNIEPREFKVGGRKDLANISVKIAVIENEAVVVYSTGYEQIPPNQATGSFEFVDKEELNRRVGTDILSRLDGTTTSILFDRRTQSASQSTIPLSNIIIRGLSTLTTFPETIRQPLVVVNNFPYDGDIANINPNDVENITILKDAAAASIWGARAANGVIVIRTKQGQFNQPVRISFNSNVQVTEIPDLFHFPKMSPTDFIDVETYLFAKGFYDGTINSNRYPAISPVVEILAKRRAGMISPADSAEQIDALRNQDVRHDFEKYIYRKAVTQQYFLNVNGGNEKLRYSIGTGFDKRLSSLKGDDYNRFTLSSDNVISVTRELSLQLGFRYTGSSSSNNSIGEYGSPVYAYRNNTQRLYPYARFADANGNPLAVTKDFRNGYIDTAGAGELLDWQYVPLNEIRNADNRYLLSDVVLNGGITFHITSSLTATGNYQYQSSRAERKSYYSTETYFTRNLVNLFTNLNETNLVMRHPVPVGGIFDHVAYGITSHYGRGQLSFNRTLNGKHQVNALGGAEIREVVSDHADRRSYGYDKDKLSSSLIDYITKFPQYGNRGIAAIPAGPNGYGKRTDHFVSVFTNVAYTFDSRYTISGSARRDAANIFGVNLNDKWKPFWSVGAAWNIANESFFNIKTISFLKLRATYGYQGNVNNSLSPYTILSYIPASSSPYNQPFANIATPANPGLSWENIRQLNIGLDLRIWEERLNGSLDVYRKKSDNLILSSSIDPTTGVSSVQRNSAAMTGSGFDLSLNIQAIRKPLLWNIEIMLSHIKNKITETKIDESAVRAEGAVSGSGLYITTRTGISPYAIFSYPFAGLDPLTGDPQGYLGKTVSKDYLALSNQLLDTSNIIYHGSAIPTYFGNFNHHLEYRGLILSVSINYRFGYYFRKNTISYYALYRNGVQHPDFGNRWQKPGDEALTNIPSMIYPLSNSRRDDFYAFSSANVLKADNIRLQYIKLGYTIDGNILKRTRIKSIQIYSTIENLGLIWRANKEGLDPDYDAGNTAYPPPKRIAFAVKLDF